MLKFVHLYNFSLVQCAAKNSLVLNSEVCCLLATVLDLVHQRHHLCTCMYNLVHLYTFSLVHDSVVYSLLVSVCLNLCTFSLVHM